MRRFIVICIILTGIFLRLYNYYNLFYFAIDEEKGAYIIKGIVDGTHFPTVGHPSSIGFRLGPILYYLIAPFYTMFGKHPIVWGYVSVFASILSTVFIYKIGAVINKKTGIIALILYAFSYLNTLYDRRGWQVSFHSLIALSTLYALLLIKRKKTIGLYLLTATLIAATQFEVATILFVPLVLLSFWKWLPFSFVVKSQKKHLLLCTFLFVFSHIGLLVFDVRHQFLNTRYLINYFNPHATDRVQKNIPLEGLRTVYLAHNLIPSTFSRLLFASSEPNAAIQYANCPQYLSYKQESVPLLLKFLILTLFIWYFTDFFRNRRQTSEETFIKKHVAVYFFILFGGIALYTYAFHGEMAEYYLASSFSYFFIILAVFLANVSSSKYGRYVVFLFLLFFMIDNGNKLFKSYNPYGLHHKESAIRFIQETVGDKPFIHDSFQTCWSTGGYRYLFTYAGHEPATSYMDQYMSEYYSPYPTVLSLYRVTILTPELIGTNPQGYEAYKDQVKKHAIENRQFGAIEIYIEKLPAP